MPMSVPMKQDFARETVRERLYEMYLYVDVCTKDEIEFVSYKQLYKRVYM